MRDEKVVETQEWMNSTYSNNPSWIKIEVDGETGIKTVTGLIRALQIELGLDVDGSFGPGTKNAFDNLFPNGLSKETTPDTQQIKNITCIVNGGLWCRGIEGDWENLEAFSNTTDAGIILMKTQLGLENPNGVIRAVEMKAILTTDAYVITSDGSDEVVRQIQQRLNREYLNVLGDYLATNGLYERNTNKALIKVFQSIIGVEVDGSFGPNTMNSAPALQKWSSNTELIYILQYMLYLNGFDPNGFDGSFGNGAEQAVKNFQEFSKLSVDGSVGPQTWASLFISCGDTSRRGEACDCITEITDARAKTLKSQGYKTIGRYLTNATNMNLDKNIKEGEIQTILRNGLTIFPIFQTWGIYVDYFSNVQGANDAIEAYKAARKYGFKRGTIIYFAVDYDTYDDEIESNIIPYFEAINSKFESYDNYYQVGIYGTRNVCTKVSNKGLAVKSFVSDMSYGYSGNIGHKLPDNWAYDQISTITIGSGEGQIEIDNNISRIEGENEIEQGVTLEKDDVTSSGVLFDATLQRIVNHLENEMNVVQKAKALRSREEAVNMVKLKDSFITSMSNKYKVRKSLIQTVLAWEYALEGQDDSLADSLVRNYYEYKEALEEWLSLPPDEQESTVMPTPPTMFREDCSTGIGQIFASTAISAYNFAIDQHIISDTVKKDVNDWKQVWEEWKKLNTLPEYNIEMATLVLIHAANLVGINRYSYDYNSDEITKTLARYNGTGDDAANYGNRRKIMYDIFEEYNSTNRGE